MKAAVLVLSLVFAASCLHAQDVISTGLGTIREHESLVALNNIGGKLWYSYPLGIGWLHKDKPQQPLSYQDSGRSSMLYDASIIRQRSDTTLIVSKNYTSDVVESGDVILVKGESLLARRYKPFSLTLPEPADAFFMDSMVCLIVSPNKARVYNMRLQHRSDYTIKEAGAAMLLGEYIYILGREELHQYDKRFRHIRSVKVATHLGLMKPDRDGILVLSKGGSAQLFSPGLKAIKTIPYPFPLQDSSQVLRLNANYLIVQQVSGNKEVALLDNELKASWQYNPSQHGLSSFTCADTAYGRMYLGGGQQPSFFATPIDLKNKKPINPRADVALEVNGYRFTHRNWRGDHYNVYLRIENLSSDTLKSCELQIAAHSAGYDGSRGPGALNIDSLTLAQGEHLDTAFNILIDLWSEYGNGPPVKYSLRYPNGNLDYDPSNNIVEHSREDGIRLGLGKGRVSEALCIYPNPARNKLYLTLKTNPKQQARLIMYDLPGRAVLSKAIMEQNTIIDLSGLPTGGYFYELIEGNQTISQGKLVRY